MTKHPDIDRPDSVSHFICPDGPTAEGQPVATHHLVPKPTVDGRLTCRYCGRSEGQLRRQTPALQQFF